MKNKQNNLLIDRIQNITILNGMRILIISFIVVVLDQITKLVVKHLFFLGESITVFGDWFRFTYIENPGMAFGIRIGGRYFFTIFASIATIVILYYLYRLRKEELASRVSLALIFGGAIGNLIDRFAYGRVIDFIDIGFGNIRWPVFNIADSAVSVGMVILIAFVVFEKKNDETLSHDTPDFLPDEPTPSDENDNWRKAKS